MSMPKTETEIVPLNDGKYQVGGNQLWRVGPRYILHRKVGAGSYGDVCKATDLETNQTVALKRIANILSNDLLVKRELREVCIMRHLSHPYIISLTDVFINASVESKDAIDLYIATEFADWGDMYHLKQVVTANDVKLLIWQLLVGVKYMHSCGVWHRDIKSENVLLTSRMRVKICDFGLSRSAEEAASGFEPRNAPVNRGRPSKKVLTRQYTKVVVTPSYRAPEVIMSQGQYNSTIDIWSLGCIFWELLIRSVTKSCGPPTNPLFGLRAEIGTPKEGINYTKDCSVLAQQLDVIFNVIGTPCWKDIESVPSERWREYLRRMPGRAGNLERSLSGSIEEEAIDLLSRMLTFDPARRCTAEEALAHDYFKNIKKPTDARQIMAEEAALALTTGSMWQIRDPSLALDQLERELEAYERDRGSLAEKLKWLLQREVEQQRQQDLIRRSFLCSFAAAKLRFLRREAVPSSSSLQHKEFTSAQRQAVEFAAQNLVPVPNQYAVNHSDRNGQGTFSCSCDSCVNKGKNIAQNSGNAGEPLRKRKLPRKTIIRQGSFRVEIDSECADVLPPLDVNAWSTCPMASAGMQFVENQNQQDNTMRPGIAVQSSSSSEKGKNAGLSRSLEGVKNLQDAILPRRSPRIQDEGNGMPLRKRTRIQAG